MRQPAKRGFVVELVLASWILSIASAFLYTSYVDSERERIEREKDREWCSLVGFYSDLFRDNPPQSKTQIDVRNYMEQRKRDLDCPA